MARILVVDDDDDMRMMLEMWLGRTYEVSSASDGAEALSQIKMNSFDLVLLDLNMPVMDGIGTLKAIRSDSSIARTKTAFLTGEEDESVLKDTEELAPVAFLNKNMGKKAILARIEEIL